MRTAPAPRLSAGRVILAAVLTVIALAFFAVGAGYLAAIADAFATWLGDHPLRAAGSLIAGTVFTVGAWFCLRYQVGDVRDAG